MKEFEFELQSVLDLKEQKEKVIQKELIELKNNYQTVKDELKKVKEHKQQWQTELEAKSEAGIKLKELKKYKQYIDYLTKEEEELSLRLEEWKKKVDECQRRLLDKVKERKTLSRLKEREYEEYWQDFLQEEQKLNDEIALSNFNH
jgi:flagellar FliJ protein